MIQKTVNEGIIVLEFVHPRNKHIIQVPYYGGDEYVDPKTQRVFIIFVDREGRTIIIFKGFNRIISPKTDPPQNGQYCHSNFKDVYYQLKV